jgi:hypothetical protein
MLAFVFCKSISTAARMYHCTRRLGRGERRMFASLAAEAAAQQRMPPLNARPIGPSPAFPDTTIPSLCLQLWLT